MHERERHRIILETAGHLRAGRHRGRISPPPRAAPRRRSDATSRPWPDRTGLRKLRGGAEALHPPNRGAARTTIAAPGAAPSPTSLEKRAIGRKAAVELCEPGDDSIIINGGTTTFQMVHAMDRTSACRYSPTASRHRRPPAAPFGAARSSCPSGTVYREQNIILSPLPGRRHACTSAPGACSWAARGLSALRASWSEDALIMSSEQRLMGQADELVLLVDASKFRGPILA